MTDADADEPGLEELTIWPAVGLMAVIGGLGKLFRPDVFSQTVGSSGGPIPNEVVAFLWIIPGLFLIVVPPVSTYRELQEVRQTLEEHGVADVHEEGMQ